MHKDSSAAFQDKRRFSAFQLTHLHRGVGLAVSSNVCPTLVINYTAHSTSNFTWCLSHFTTISSAVFHRFKSVGSAEQEHAFYNGSIHLYCACLHQGFHCLISRIRLISRWAPPCLNFQAGFFSVVKIMLKFARIESDTLCLYCSEYYCNTQKSI